MKKLLYIPFILFLFTGCFEDPGTEIVFGDDIAFLEFSNASTPGNDTRTYPVLAGGTETYTDSVKIAFIGQTPSQEISVNYEIVPDQSTAVEGVDFTLLGNGTVTIPAGSFEAGFAYSLVGDVAILDPTAAPLTITFRITGGSMGEPSTEYGEHTIYLQGVCPPEVYDYTTMEGSYTATASGESTDACPTNNPVEDLVTEGITLTLNTELTTEDVVALDISNMFGGLYQAWYADCYGYAFPTPGTILVDRTTGAISGSIDDFFGGSGAFDVTGRVDACNGNFTLSWINTYGDDGNISFVGE